jgi:PAS domain S-box-containing protein
MCLNYLILPWLLKQPVPPGEVRPQDMYAWLRWMRALLITSIVSLGYLFFRYVEYRTNLTDLGMIAFIGTLQFLPGIVASLHWRQATRIGLTVGLLGGFGIWYLTLLLPVLGTPHPLLVVDVVGLNHNSDLSIWTLSSIYSLGLNTALFILVSLLTQRSQQEKLSAEICSTDPTDRPLRTTLVPKTIEQFIDNLAGVMGKSNSEEMVNRSLSELRLSSTETRPYALRSLRNRIEANLSGLFGPGVAHEIVERCIPYQLGLHPFSEDMNLIENRLDTATLPLTGLAADLDSLRRYHRDTLHNLPIGVCCMADDGEVLMWNRSMAKMTGLAADNIVGADFAEIPQPWLALLTELRQGSSITLHKCKIDLPGQTPRWVSLNRSAIESHKTANRDEIIVMEDITDYQRLEQELMHTERLASVGRIAAGVAHEIGNPITGIACLAQNLREETSDESVQESANDILSQTERVSRIVHVLVNYSHGGKATQLPIETRPVNVQHCATEAIQLLTLDKDAKDVVFLNKCEPGHEVSADPQRLLQILINLLSNARDASALGQCVTVGSEDRGTDITISVSDDGSGIAVEHQDQLFEPFFTTKDPGEGTGLGLSLVYSIVDELGGQIYFASPWNPEMHSGTRFSVSLPISPLYTGNITQ